MAPHRCCARDCFNSQVNTKDIYYFAFPKSEYYAHKWATAAGRQDLTSKPLQSITKYFLCSEHFTEDSFIDPPHNTKLKKTTRPVKVPMPTIFKNNIHKFVPGCYQIVQDNGPHPPNHDSEESTDVMDAESTTTILVIPEQLAELARTGKRKLGEQPNGDVDDIIEVVDDDETLDGSYDGLERDSDGNEMENAFSKHVCRLCASEFHCDQLIHIFADRLIHKTVDFVLPDQIKENYGYSELICPECLEKAGQCMEIIRGFRNAQVKLQKESLSEEC